jgi:hypothetical protein
MINEPKNCKKLAHIKLVFLPNLSEIKPEGISINRPIPNAIASIKPISLMVMNFNQ